MSEKEIQILLTQRQIDNILLFLDRVNFKGRKEARAMTEIEISISKGIEASKLNNSTGGDD